MMSGIEIRGEMKPGYEAVLTEPALAFIAHLHRMYEPTRRSLLRAREERRRWWAAGNAIDFAPVGIAVAAAGLLFVVLVGWRMVPARRGAAEKFDTGAYLTEARVPEGSKADGRTLREVEADLVLAPK